MLLKLIIDANSSAMQLDDTPVLSPVSVLSEDECSSEEGFCKACNNCSVMCVYYTCA